MSVASIATAAARPTPICLKSIIDRVAKTANTATMIAAALVTTPAVRVMPNLPPSDDDNRRVLAVLAYLDKS